jgi:hypothetical protein
MPLAKPAANWSHVAGKRHTGTPVERTRSTRSVTERSVSGRGVEYALASAAFGVPIASAIDRQRGRSESADLVADNRRTRRAF